MSDCVATGPDVRPPVQPDPRARLVMALILAFAFAAVGNVMLLPVLGMVALAVLALSGAAVGVVLRRLRGAGVLALGVVLILPFVTGDQVLWQFGPLRWHAEGLAAGLLIGGRLLAIVTVTLAFLTPLPPFRLVAGARALGVPTLMADLALLTLRYLDELRAELARAMLARRLRGGKGGWRGLSDYGVILAAVLIRSHRRAERLWAAMRLRGYGAGVAQSLPPLAARARWGMVLVAAGGVALVLLDRAI
ncbi:energy-coupling factor transporter transmembrane component T family protein [Roseinatronobacter alkalisoli]|uniref:Energy-coupling factor transporter transmembrane component T n=1 Tax=Roseinatronobacter alkalisoli TaxID=3028235 RepID=A0ABT5T7Q6_9RHOB|nr:energy-coupling factor transporter transmembrane component T [Roseinatronobacter sp. HJB301]MDD7971153.1 energy-coupling factor transporter transmembrane component T [Roseinatronobacter sp. HJB301]